MPVFEDSYNQKILNGKKKAVNRISSYPTGNRLIMVVWSPRPWEIVNHPHLKGSGGTESIVKRKLWTKETSFQLWTK